MLQNFCSRRSLVGRYGIGVLLVLIIVLVGCDDPSSVGLELVGGSNGEPISFTASPSQFENESGRDVTGGRTKVLAGTVDDPLSGSVSARGFLDFAPATSRSSAFLDGPVTSVSLRLYRTYTYGDTLQGGSLLVSDVPEEWDEIGFPSDSSIAVGAQVTQVSFQPTDTLVVVDLPANWVAANDTTLRSTTQSTSFHGFALDAIGLNAVVGFADTSVLRVVSGGDTLDYRVQLSATVSNRLTQPSPPANILLLQDTEGPTIGVDFDLGADTLADAVINKFVFKLSTDSLVLENQTPANFSRPAPEFYDLIAVTKDDALILLDTKSLADDGTLTFRSDLLLATYQNRFLDNSNIDHLRIAIGAGEMGLGLAAFVAPSAASAAPQATIIISRFQK